MGAAAAWYVAADAAASAEETAGAAGRDGVAAEAAADSLAAGLGAAAAGAAVCRPGRLRTMGDSWLGDLADRDVGETTDELGEKTDLPEAVEAVAEDFRETVGEVTGIW